MTNRAVPAIDTSHWAYQQGHIAGTQGNTTERGIMAFGLSCSADAQTARNTRHWLAGYDAGAAQALAARQAPPKHYNGSSYCTA
jgi:hypothetical protein